MSQANSAVKDQLLCYPAMRVLSDSKDLGSAGEFAARIENDNIRDTGSQLALRRLAGIASIGVNLRLIDGTDLARFDHIVKDFRSMTVTSQEKSLRAEHFKFLASYSELFDYDYYVSGARAVYVNYDWEFYQSHVTASRVEAIIERVMLSSGANILDFGCALGFYVHEFRRRDCSAIGCDISKYAINRAHPCVKDHIELFDSMFAKRLQGSMFDCILVKDVLEHVPESILTPLWSMLENAGKVVVATVPIAERNKKFLNPEDEDDVTHLVRRKAEWWMNLFGPNAVRDDDLCHALKGTKSRGTLCVTINSG